MLSPDDLSWLDEGIRRSDESDGDCGDGDDDGDSGDDDDGNDGDDGYDDESGYRGDGDNNEETHGVGGSQRGGAMTWDLKYYTAQDTDHEG